MPRTKEHPIQNSNKICLLKCLKAFILNRSSNIYRSRYLRCSPNSRPIVSLPLPAPSLMRFGGGLESVPGTPSVAKLLLLPLRERIGEGGAVLVVARRRTDIKEKNISIYFLWVKVQNKYFENYYYSSLSFSQPHSVSSQECFNILCAVARFSGFKSNIGKRKLENNSASLRGIRYFSFSTSGSRQYRSL